MDEPVKKEESKPKNKGTLNRRTALSTDIVKTCRQLEWETYQYLDVLTDRVGKKNLERPLYGMRTFARNLVEDARDARMNIISAYKIDRNNVLEKSLHYSFATSYLDNFEADFFLLYKFGPDLVKDDEYAKFAALLSSIRDMTQRLVSALGRSAESTVTTGSGVENLEVEANKQNCD